MADPTLFTSVTDNSLLPFGETMVPRDFYNREEGPYDITTIFEDGIKLGTGTYESLFVGTKGKVSFGSALDQTATVNIANFNLFSRPSYSFRPGEQDAVFIDLNEERESVVITWNNLPSYHSRSINQRYTFQLEILDLGDGDSEMIFRYNSLDALSHYIPGIGIFGPGIEGLGRLSAGLGRFDELDTKVGNTGVEGVLQFRFLDGQAQAAVDIAGETLVGTDQDDVLTGTPFGDEISSGSGNNTIYALAGNDVVATGAGDDLIEAFGGNNLITAGEGHNTIRSGDGNDTISTEGDGNDLINAGHGNNLVNASGGDDIIRFGGTGKSTIDAGSGDDYIDGSFLNAEKHNRFYDGPRSAGIEAGEGNDTILGTNYADVISGQAGNDSVLAGAGRDYIFGGGGDDILTGGFGSDTIDGGDGDDFIFGGVGRDIATGGAGQDRFFVSGEYNDEMHITDYNYDEGDFLVINGDLFDRDAFAIRYTMEHTANGVSTRDFQLGITTDEGWFQNFFTFENHADLTKILLRLPAEEDGPVAPILFDLSPI
ncbi:calcium-binding protein [Sulfitobacter sp. F26169L]|uniref:calcium-binding protein n=1 Tax=Sulfitobacter sp. F26169L TaxID=2996015 RepID=UPI002260A2E6|nr:calcium-binding protein [Sulfitobacter sp. F26169L]MCX7566667.1 calcium-binding protein [Sulfitobacter sp. F26169L]